MSLDATPDPHSDGRARASKPARIGNSRDFVAGLVFIAIGIAALIGASEYPLGTVRSIGPGYYPILVGIALALLGAAIAFKGLKPSTGPESTPDEGGLALRPLVFVVAAVVAFGLLVRPFGLAAAIVALIVISSLAGRDFNIVRVTLLCIGMTVLAWLVFIYVLGLNMSMWPR